MIDLESEAAAPAPDGAPAWMVTFADMMSLLLTFFILILSFTKTDLREFAAAAASMQAAFGTDSALHHPTPPVVAAPVAITPKNDAALIALSTRGGETQTAALLREIGIMIRRHHLENLVEVEESERGVVVRVIGHLLFDPAAVDLRPESFVLLSEVANLVRSVPEPLSIEGHSDDTPAVNESNWRISAERAISVLEYLVRVQGIAPQRLSIAGYGDTRPLAPNDTHEHREANRRVELVFLKAAPAAAAADSPR